MKKTAISRLLLVCLIVCVMCVLLIAPMGCDSMGKKAIIILPGIMGSNIIDAETGNPLWAPVKKGLDIWTLETSDYLNLIMNNEDVNKLLNVRGEGGGLEWIHKMKVNADGTVNNHNEPQYIEDDGTVRYPNCSTYGTVECYQKTYKFLKENFGDEYDVRIFEYDWRLNNQDSAEKLEKFIKDHKYKDVTLVGHSMGGVLASTYLARSEKNRKICNTFISCGTPFFGAHKALRVPEDPMSLVGGGNMDMLLNIVKNLVNSKSGGDEQAWDDFYNEFLQFVRDLPTIYQLIPYADMCGAYNEDFPDLADEGILKVDGTPLKTYDEFMDFLKTRSFVNERCLSNMVAWQQEQYVDGEHVSKLVNTEYLIGYGLETECGVEYEDDKMVGSLYSTHGDGTVASYSATCGLKLDDPKVTKFNEVSHMNLIYEDECLAKIKDIITTNHAK